MCPYLGSLLVEKGQPARGMIAHCLLIETNDGLVLVDTGFGTADCTDKARLPAAFHVLVRPALSLAETAVEQVKKLGFSPADVRHVIPTHLDLDHAGGLPDFPDAKVHIYGAELDAALQRKTLAEKERYRPAHFAHGPKWVRHVVRGDRWNGFDAVRDIEGLPPEILLVPTIGHTRGHVAVAVDDGHGWMLHCGDAYFHHAEMDPERPRCPLGLRVFQRTMAFDDVSRVRNSERLRLLAKDTDVRVFSAHDPVELERMQIAAESRAA
jgi:glyoxylase-like metal-dependent hydrolase (beta-lactamase superfamily II)